MQRVLWATGQVAGTRVQAQVDGESSVIQSEPTCPHHALMGVRPIPHDLSHPDPVKQHDQGNSVLEMRPQDPERLRKFSRSHSSLSVHQEWGLIQKEPEGKKASRWKQGIRV